MAALHQLFVCWGVQAKEVAPVPCQKSFETKTSPAYGKGLSHLPALYETARHLRQKGLDPFSTHIPALAHQVLRHLKLIEEGIYLQGEPQLGARLQVFKAFQKEAFKRLQNQNITFEWWLFANWHWSFLASRPPRLILQKLSSLRDRDQEANSLFSTISSLNTAHRIRQALVDDFPSHIPLPISYPLGVMAFNRVILQKIYPAELVALKQVTDGVSAEPYQHFEHDLFHYEDMVLLNLYEPEWDFYRLLIQKTELLQPPEREMAEMEIFLILHEGFEPPSGRGPLSENKSSSFYHTLMDRLATKGDLSHLLPAGVDLRSRKQITKYLQKSRQVFNQVIKSLPSEVVPEDFTLPPSATLN